MGLMSAIRQRFSTSVPAEREWWPFVNMGGTAYPVPILNQTLQGTKEEIGGDYVGLVQGAYKSNGVVFACLLARRSLFSEARFQFRQIRSGRPGDLFGTSALDILEHPWPNATTGDLLNRAIDYADLAGNAFVVRDTAFRLKMLRPDWWTIIHGSANDPNVGMWDPEAELLGYAYQPGGPAGGRQPVFYLPQQVAHFAPIPDPLAPARGMSWLTPLVREVEADSAATAHKLQYFRNGATPNLVVTGVPGTSPAAFQDWVDRFGGKHDGLRNAYKTIYLSATADAKVVGSNFEQVDFKVTQGAGETRIAAAAGVPPVVVGLSEGLQGSSLNAGNFAASMRRFADITMRPLWRNISGSLATIVPPPPLSELWYDDRDIPALRDSITDAAQVRTQDAATMRQLIDAGFEPESVVAAVGAGDWKRLRHTGLYSVQLQPPMPEGPEPEAEPESDTEDAE